MLQNSQELVRNHRHNQWDVEHIILALFELEDGVPSKILKELGVPSKDIRADYTRRWNLLPNWSMTLTRCTLLLGPSG